MARSAEMRWRVERLLAGDLQTEHMTRLFLWLRQRTYGVVTIKEVGHFIAHPDERNLGPVTKEVQDFFTFLRLRLPLLGETIDLSNMPPGFKAALLGNFRKITAAIIKRDTGLKRKDAGEALKSALDKFSDDTAQAASLKTALTPNELAILRCCLSYIVSKPAFTAADLYRDFVFVLCKNKLLDNAEKPRLETVRSLLVLYAITSMHQVDLILEDGWNANLSAGVFDGRIQVTATAKVPSKKSEVSVAFPFFETDLRAEEWVEPSLIPDKDAHWLCPIYLTSVPRPILIGL